MVDAPKGDGDTISAHGGHAVLRDVRAAAVEHKDGAHRQLHRKGRGELAVVDGGDPLSEQDGFLREPVEAIISNQKQADGFLREPVEAIMSSQKQSEAIRSNRKQSDGFLREPWEASSRSPGTSRSVAGAQAAR